LCGGAGAGDACAGEEFVVGEVLVEKGGERCLGGCSGEFGARKGGGGGGFVGPFGEGGAVVGEAGGGVGEGEGLEGGEWGGGCCDG